MPDPGRATIATTIVAVDDELASTTPGAHPGRYVKLTFADRSTRFENLSTHADPF